VIPAQGDASLALGYCLLPRRGFSFGSLRSQVADIVLPRRERMPPWSGSLSTPCAENLADFAISIFNLGPELFDRQSARQVYSYMLPPLNAATGQSKQWSASQT